MSGELNDFHQKFLELELDALRSLLRPILAEHDTRICSLTSINGFFYIPQPIKLPQNHCDGHHIYVSTTQVGKITHAHCPSSVMCSQTLWQEPR